jgi:enoyl-CoA hydratase/carnithine racemase
MAASRLAVEFPQHAIGLKDVTKFILVDRRDRVGIVTLNRPDVLNAWHRPMREEFISALSAMHADDRVGAIVVTGAGDRAFGAGQDLKEIDLLTTGNVEQWVRQWEKLYDRIRSLTKPLVAALNGVAVGSAFHVALLADFRIAHPGVRLGQPEIDAGIPSVMGPWIMREMLGLNRCIDLTLTGRLMDADECQQLGLFFQLVSREQVLPEALALAQRLAQKPQTAMQLNKQRFREMTESGFRECIEATLRYQRQSLALGGLARAAKG